MYSFSTINVYTRESAYQITSEKIRCTVTRRPLTSQIRLAALRAVAVSLAIEEEVKELSSAALPSSTELDIVKRSAQTLVKPE